MADIDQRTDEILGITRCAQCGHRLDGGIECPFCAAMRGFDETDAPRPRLPLWVYMTAMFLTFPLSLPWLVMSRRLTPWHKIVFVLVFVLWFMALGAWFL